MVVVTTFNQKGYEAYAKRFLETWHLWPAPLYVYSEGVELPEMEGVTVLDLEESCPSLVEFKLRHGTKPKKFQFDAVRFAHKVFAIIHAARTLKGKMFWCDADVVAHQRMPLSFLDSCLPDDCLTSCLKRTKLHSECGFVGYNLNHPLMPEFIADLERMYTEDLLFKLDEQHDSYVYDVVRKRFEAKGAKTHNLSGQWEDTFHPFINSDLGNYLDHLKGPRKQEDRSHKHDLKRERTEAHWK